MTHLRQRLAQQNGWKPQERVQQPAPRQLNCGTALNRHRRGDTVAVSLYPNLAYKPDIEFEPIGLVVEVPLVLGGAKGFSGGTI